MADRAVMVDGVSDASRPDPYRQNGYERPLPETAKRTADNVANAPWITDPDRLGFSPPPSALIFSNPAMGGKPVLFGPPNAFPEAAAPSDKLPAAANARTGITLANLAEDIPSGTRTLPARVQIAGNYRFYPEVSKGADGKDAIHYWTAYNTDTKRVEFLIGPDSIETFKTQPKLYTVAAENAFMGEQDAETRASAKVVEIGMRDGFGAALRQLGNAWRIAGTDPKWLAKTAFNVVTASAGGKTTTSATCAEASSEFGAVGAAADVSPAASTARAHALADINPGGINAPGRSLNCINCAVATDASLAGNPATALPSKGTLQLGDVTAVTGGKFVPVASASEIEARLLREGPGSRAIVAASRPFPQQGHVFNAVNVEGRVYFLDGQRAGVALADPSYIKLEMLQTFPRRP